MDQPQRHHKPYHTHQYQNSLTQIHSCIQRYFQVCKLICSLEVVAISTSTFSMQNNFRLFFVTTVTLLTQQYYLINVLFKPTQYLTFSWSVYPLYRLPNQDTLSLSKSNTINLLICVFSYYFPKIFFPLPHIFLPFTEKHLTWASPIFLMNILPESIILLSDSAFTRNCIYFCTY